MFHTNHIVCSVNYILSDNKDRDIATCSHVSAVSFVPWDLKSRAIYHAMFIAIGEYKVMSCSMVTSSIRICLVSIVTGGERAAGIELG